MTDQTNHRQVPSCPGGTVYTILPGDTYYGLSKRFNTTVAAITNANPGVSPENLRIGQQICIPAASTGNCPGGFLYVIKSGDTYYSLAQRFGTVVPAMQAANPGVDPNRLNIGQSICIPAQGPGPGPGPVQCPGGRTHTIVSGDTLYALAKTYNTTVDKIIAANPGIMPNSLQVGRIICIPS